MKTFLHFFFCLLLICNLYACPIDQLIEKKDKSILEVKNEKIYIKLDRIKLSNDGIFIQTDTGRLIPLSNIAFDESGYYTFKYKCKRGHDGIIKYKDEWYCADSDCPYNYGNIGNDTDDEDD